ncbi:MAG: bile acid:sodium symporter [Sphingomonadales bacterium 32-68-7]|nr:MAG: bile acid:sodium symporter [Sphingomonadales bacterium 12-68-11]OYX07711.1 MAG: bile acid:sodium symporter [Sphingomonadales bacterium 32-68-7]
MPVLRFLSRVDPLVRLLLLAIVLATVLPVTGAQRPVAQGVSNGAVFLLFLLNGLRLPRREVRAGLAHGRFLIPLAAWCFLAMGAAGWALWGVGSVLLPANVALGLLFLGVLPSTVQSATAYTSLAGGNVANAVVAAAVLNVLGVFLAAPLFALAAGSSAADFDWASLERIALILLLPFALGQIAQDRFGHLVRDHRALATWLDRLSIAIAVYVAFSGAVEQGLWTRMGLIDWAALLGLVAVFLAFGFGGAWALGGGLGLARRDRIAFLFAGGQKSIALGAPLASVLFPPAVAGLLLLPVLTYHLLQLVLSAPLAARLNRPEAAR